jgi:hypothetical protein
MLPLSHTHPQLLGKKQQKTPIRSSRATFLLRATLATPIKTATPLPTTPESPPSHPYFLKK